MKTLNMFLVLSTLTITACSGGVPETNPAPEEPSAAATPQSSPEGDDETIPHDFAIVVTPLEGTTGASPSGQPGAASGGAATAGPSGRTRHQQ